MLEYALLAFTILMIWSAVMNVIKNKQFFQTVFGQPWARLQNEIEFGIPLTDSKLAGSQHPSGYGRHSTHAEGP